MPKPGDIGLVQVKNLRLRWFIRLGQWLVGDGFADYEHAFVCTAVFEEYAEVIQAEPNGADASWYELDKVRWSNFDLTDEQRTDIVYAAEDYIGTPYSFLDYLAIFAHHLRIPIPHLQRYIASTGHMICSQLVDQCYQDAGVHLFNDHRWPGYVTPGDLYQLVENGRA